MHRGLNAEEIRIRRMLLQQPPVEAVLYVQAENLLCCLVMLIHVDTHEPAAVLT
jgi:hypothetical protein